MKSTYYLFGNALPFLHIRVFRDSSVLWTEFKYLANYFFKDWYGELILLTLSMQSKQSCRNVGNFVKLQAKCFKKNKSLTNLQCYHGINSTVNILQRFFRLLAIL